jgi:hypothetical protein
VIEMTLRELAKVVDGEVRGNDGGRTSAGFSGSFARAPMGWRSGAG